MRSSVAVTCTFPPDERTPSMLERLFAPTVEASAHCDLPCGVYDPAQARIAAESIKAVIGKLADNDDPDFRTRAILIKEERSELVKHRSEEHTSELQSLMRSSHAVFCLK